jgi:hypothetical protein
MSLKILLPAALALFSTAAMAEQASVEFRCDGKMEKDEAVTELNQFSISIEDKAVKIEGLSDLDAKFALIQKDEQFFVFKNARKTQGGNIERPTGKLYLYAVDKAAHKLTLSVNGLCAKEN